MPNVPLEISITASTSRKLAECVQKIIDEHQLSSCVILLATFLHYSPADTLDWMIINLARARGLSESSMREELDQIFGSELIISILSNTTKPE